MPPRKELTRHDLKRIGLECVNINLRRASRVVTRLYDEALEPAGITSSQFSVLVAVAIYENTTISALADILSKERTTLTRNLRPLEKNGWITIDRGEDARSRVLRMTKDGHAVIARAVPLRDAMHAKLLDVMGADDWNATRHTLVRLLKVD